MREFRINEKIAIVCNSENARNGFRHRATLLINGIERDETTVHYINRTWESYEFQTVMQKLIDKTTALTPAEKVGVKKWLQGDRTDWSGFQMTGMIAKVGEVLTKNKEEKVAWQERMLKAGLGNQGLEFPEDWNKLPIKTREARLSAVVNQLAGAGKKKKKVKSSMDIEKTVERMAGI